MIATEKQKLPKLQFGEGTLAYTDTGTIAYKKYVELSDGSKVRKTVNSTSITKCIKRMRDVEEDLKTRSKPDKTQVNLKGEIYYWLENVKKNQLKTQSYNRIESIARNNIIPWELADKRVSLITSKELQRFINELNDGDHSYSSIKKVFDCLNEFYRFVSTRDHIDNPMETVVCVSKENVIKETKEVEYLDSEDIKKFKDQALKTWDSSGKQRYRYGYVLVANLYLGLRIGELLALKWRDVNFKGRYIDVNKTLIEEYNPRYDRNDPERMKKKNISKMIFRIQKSTKTNKNRKVPINNAAMYYLKKHYELTEYGKMNDFVIATKSGKNSNVRNIQNSIKSILKYNKDPDLIPIMINKAALVENSIVTTEMRDRFADRGQFCCRVPGTWEADENKEHILMIPLDHVFEADEGRSYIAFMDKKHLPFVLKAGDGTPATEYFGMRTQEFVNQFFQEAEASVLPERVIDAAKSLAETVSVHLKQPAPPIKVR